MSTDPQRHPDRGLVHVVPVIGVLLGGVVYPLHVLVRTFRLAAADVGTQAGAPYAAAVAAFLAGVAGLLVAAFVTMVAYSVCRFGSTRLVRVSQVAGLVVTTIGCAAGIWLAVIVATELS